jgi:thioredoxin reductase
LEFPPGSEGKILHEAFPIRQVRDKRVVIVGAGDAAFDYALGLAGQNEITVLSRKETARCLPLLERRARASPRVTYMESTELTGIESTSESQLRLLCTHRGEVRNLVADYILFAIGRRPELGFLSRRLEAALERKQKEGSLCLIGDVRTGNMRQTAIAVGDGVMAAMRICGKLKELES